MQQIHVEVIGIEPLQTFVTRAKRPFVRSVRWKNFTYQENLFANAADGLADDFFRARIHLSRIDMGHAQFNSGSQGFETILAHLPRSLTDDRYLYTRGAESTRDHRYGTLIGAVVTSVKSFLPSD